MLVGIAQSSGPGFPCIVVRKAVSFAGMRISAWYVVLIVISLAQGCGYHLRGQSPQVKTTGGYNIHITAAAASRLAAAVEAQLAGSGVIIRDSREGADYILRLHGEEFERQVLSVSPDTGKVEEYQVRLTGRISISKADGEALVTDQVIRASGDYTFDEDAALGKFAEEETIKEELVEQAAAQIIRRLNTLVE